MNDDSTILGDATMTPEPRDIIGTPPVEPGVPRGYLCEYCPELRERVRETHTLVGEYGNRLVRIEEKLDAVKAEAASAAVTRRDEISTALKDISEKENETAIEIALLKSDTRRTAAVVSGIVTGIIAFAYWAVDKALGK
ncbi:MAG: hypothetical protein V1929_06555 [bacterium]